MKELFFRHCSTGSADQWQLKEWKPIRSDSIHFLVCSGGTGGGGWWGHNTKWIPVEELGTQDGWNLQSRVLEGGSFGQWGAGG
jgi:hypothetical protein